MREGVADNAGRQVGCQLRSRLPTGPFDTTTADGRAGRNGKRISEFNVLRPVPKQLDRFHSTSLPDLGIHPFSRPFIGDFALSRERNSAKGVFLG